MRPIFISRAIRPAVCAAALVVATLGALPAQAHWVADGNNIILPDDPVPQIRFRHWHDGECDRACALEWHCGYDCQISADYDGPHFHGDYDHGYGRRGGCDDWRDRDHWAWHREPCPQDLVEGYLARARRSDDQSDAWGHAMDHWQSAMDWYDHSVIGHHDHDHDHDHDHH